MAEEEVPGKENGGKSLKRPRQENRETESPGDSSCSLADGDVSEESLLKVQREVMELAAKVAEYRKTGPAAYAHSLEESLSLMRNSIQPADANMEKSSTVPATEGEDIPSNELVAEGAALLERLAAAKACLPDIKSCKDRLYRAIAAREQSVQQRNLLQLPFD